MNKYMFLLCAVIIASVMMLSSPAFAQETNPCAADFKQYCADVTPGGGRLVRCYEERKDKMSPACVAWAALAKSTAASAKTACAKEIDAGCNTEKGDPFALVDCLQGNYVNLSMECRNKLNEFKYRYPKPNPDRTQ